MALQTISCCRIACIECIYTNDCVIAKTWREGKTWKVEAQTQTGMSLETEAIRTVDDLEFAIKKLDSRRRKWR